MQTFLTSTDPDPQTAIVQTFEMLDQQRLGKQRVEAYQILLSYEEQTKKQPLKYQGWNGLPAVRMWAGHLPALCVYGIINCMVWRRHGHSDSLLAEFQKRRRVYLANDPDAVQWPWWFGHCSMVRTHQTKLYHKNSPKWVDYHQRTAPKHHVMKLPYLWPDPFDEDIFRISKAESKRSDWEIPSSWAYDVKSRIVVPR